MAPAPVGTKPTPDSQLRTLIARLPAREQKLFRAVRSALRKRVPTANELVYDYHSFFILGYSATEHPLDGVLSIAARPAGICLYFNQGPRLPDPEKLLKGSGKEVRFIAVESARRLAHPHVKALIAAAIAVARTPLPTGGKGHLVIRTFGGKRARSPKPRKQ